MQENSKTFESPSEEEEAGYRQLKIKSKPMRDGVRYIVSNSSCGRINTGRNIREEECDGLLL